MVPLGLDMRTGEYYWDSEERIALRQLDLGRHYDQQRHIWSPTDSRLLARLAESTAMPSRHSENSK